MAGEDRTITVQFLADLAPLTAAFAEVNAEISSMVGRKVPAGFATELEASVKKADTIIAETSKHIDAVIAKKAPASNFATELTADVRKAEVAVIEMGRVIDTTAHKQAAGFDPKVNPFQAEISASATGGWGTNRESKSFEAFAANDALATKQAASAKEAATELRAGSMAAKDFAKSTGDIEAATEGASRGTKGFTSSLRAMRPDLMLVIGAVAAAAKAFQAFATEQSAETQLKAILGPSKDAAGAMEGLAKAADSQNFKASEYNDVAKSLKIAGIQTSDLTGDVRALGEASRISNVPLASLAKEVINAQEHSTGSLESMMLITEATSGATQKLTNAYREIPYALEMATRALTINSEKQEWSFKKASEQIAASSALANKKTLKDEQGQDISPGDKAYKDFQSNIFGAQTSYGFEGSWGQTKLLKDEQRKLKEGYAQMKKEYGPSTFGETQGMVQSGVWSKEDLLSAADRARGQKQESLTHDEGLQKRDMGYAAEDKQRALYAEAVADLTVQTGALAEARRAAAEAEKGSAQGMGEAVLATAFKGLVTAGKMEYQATQLPEQMGKDWGTAMQRTNLEYVSGMTFKPGTMEPIAATPAEHTKSLELEQNQQELAAQKGYGDPQKAWGSWGFDAPPESGKLGSNQAKLEDAKTHDLLSQLNTTLQRIFSGG